MAHRRPQRARDETLCMELQCELNSSLLQGRKMTIHLNGQIRKLKSVKAMVLMRNHTTKQELDEYVSMMSENLLNFKSEMLVQLGGLVKDKFDEIATIKDSLEEYIETLCSLCEEMEKLLQFDRDLSTDVNKAHTLLDGFRMLLNASPAVPDVGDIAEFQFLPSVSKDEIVPTLFGNLVPYPNGDSHIETSNTEIGTVDETGESVKDSIDERNTPETFDANLYKTDEDNRSPETVIYETVISKVDACVNTDIRGDMLDTMSGHMQPLRRSPDALPMYVNPPQMVPYPNSQLRLPMRSDGLHVAYVPSADLARQFAFNNQMFPVNANIALNVMNPLPVHSIPLPAGTPPVSSRVAPYPQHMAYPVQPFPHTLIRTSPPAGSYIPLQPVPNVDHMNTESSVPVAPPGFQSNEPENEQSVESDMNKYHKVGGCESDYIEAVNENPDENRKMNSVTEIVGDDTKITNCSPKFKCNDITTSSKGTTGADIDDTTDKNEISKSESKSSMVSEKDVDSIEAKELKYAITSSGGSENEITKNPKFEQTGTDAPKKTKCSPGSVKRFVSIFENKIHHLSPKNESTSKSLTDKSTGDQRAMNQTSEKEVEKSQAKGTGCVNSVSEASPVKHTITKKKSKSEQNSNTTNDIKDEKSKTDLSSKEDEKINNTPQVYLPPPVIEKNINDLEGSTDEEEVDADVLESVPISETSKYKIGVNQVDCDGIVINTDVAQRVGASEKTEKVSPKKLEDYLRNVTSISLHGNLSEKINSTDVKIKPELDYDVSDAGRHVLCKTFGSEFKKKLKDGELITPMKRLRRPMRMPRTPLCMTAGTKESLVFMDDGHHRQSLDSYDQTNGYDNLESCSKSDDLNSNNNAVSNSPPVGTFAAVKSEPVSPTDYKCSGIPVDENQSQNISSSSVRIEESVTPYTLKVEPTSPTNSKQSKTNTEVDNNNRRAGGTFWSPGSESNVEIKAEISPHPNSASEPEVKTEKCDVKYDETLMKNVTKRNNETLQSQVAWCKKYLKRSLSEPLNVKTERLEENWDLEIHVESDSTNCSKTAVSSDVKDSVLNYDAQPFVPETSEVYTTSTSSGFHHESSTSSKRSNSICGTVSESWDQEIETASKQINVEPGAESSDATTNPKPVDLSTEDKLSQLHSQTTTLKKFVKNIVDDAASAEKSKNERSKLGTLQQNWLKDRRGARAKLICAFGSRQSESPLHFPIGVTANNRGEIIVADTGNHNVKVYSSDGTLLKVFGEKLRPAMRRPSAAVVNNQDDVFVKDDVCIRVFDRDGKFLRNIGEDLFAKPFGLGMTTTGFLVVLDTNQRRPTLVHISQDGAKINKYLYDPLVGALPNSKCRFLAVSENHVFVSDLGLSQLYVTSLQGQFRQVIGCCGSGPQQFLEPSGIAVDTYGNLVIGDSKNNRLQVYRHDGTYCGFVDFDDGIVRPSGVHLTSDNRLIIVNFLHHLIKVYQLL